MQDRNGLQDALYIVGMVEVCWCSWVVKAGKSIGAARLGRLLLVMGMMSGNDVW